MTFNKFNEGNNIENIRPKESEKEGFKIPKPEPWPLPTYIKEFSSTEKNYLPKENGEWSGKEGDSVWKPDEDFIPKKDNPNELTWEEIKDKYDIDGIPFKDGEPDFSEVKVGEVEIEDFTSDRSKNFPQADAKLAETWTKEGKDGKVWTAQEVKVYRQQNGYTWHECKDCKTMQLVPKEVHNNIPHSGGISEAKKKEGATNV
ncbi:hypothetical protein A4G19_06410 [Pasteurellaceae bacterium Macca]|nr:hypothetical protein [Pasteurellaceae bacterium Macca]